jgi:hypothetical protein
MQKPQEPVPPTWDTEITLPLASRAYTFSDLVAADGVTVVTEPGTGRIILRTTVQAPVTEIGGMLRLDPVNSMSQARLGPFHLKPFEASISVSIPGLSPGLPVPAFADADAGPQSWVSTEYSRITLRAGELRLGVQNNLPAPVTLTSDPVLCDSAGAAIVQFRMAGTVIWPSGSANAYADLAGKTLTAVMSLGNLRLSSPGSSESAPADSMIVVDLDAHDMIATSALLAEIPPQRLVDNALIEMALTDSTRIRDLLIGAGTLRIHAHSRLGVNSRISVRFVELFDRSGLPFVDSLSVPAGGSAERALDLSGMWIRSPDGALLSTIRMFSTMDLNEGSGTAHVHLSENDRIDFDISMASLRVDSLIGVVKPTRMAVVQYMPLDLGDLNRRICGRIVVPEADLAYRPRATFSLPVELDLRCEARNPTTGGRAILPVPSTKGGTGLEEIQFVRSDVGQFLTSLSGALPESVCVAGTVLLNPAYDTTRLAVVGARTGFGGELDFGLPLTIGILGGLLCDTSAVGDTSGTGERIDGKTLDPMNSGTLYISVENGLPVEAGITVALLDRSGYPVMFLPQSSGDTVRVAAGREGLGSVGSSTTLHLTSNEIRQLNTASSIATSVALGTPSGNIVTIRSNDRVHVRIWGRFSARIEP